MSTSEEDFEVAEQPEDTCPTIDKVMNIFEDIVKNLRGYEKLDKEDLKDICSAIESDLWHYDVLLEKIRDNCSALRGWGNEWKDVAQLMTDK